MNYKGKTPDELAAIYDKLLGENKIMSKQAIDAVLHRYRDHTAPAGTPAAATFYPFTAGGNVGTKSCSLTDVYRHLCCH